MLHQAVKHHVELVLAAPVKTGSEQIAHRASVMPLAMTAPLAAPRDGPVSDGHLMQTRPIGSFARGRKLFGPERVTVQLPPQITGQPAGAELAGAAQVLLTQVHRLDELRQEQIPRQRAGQFFHNQ